MSSTSKQWRVQVKAKTGRWINKGLFETRDAARDQAYMLRVWGPDGVKDGVMAVMKGVGFGNTRVIPYVKGGAK